MPSDCSPLLPPELEREIFEIASVFHPDTIPNLLLVSHRVYEWIEKIKYRTVTPGDHFTAMCTVPSLQRAIRSNSKLGSFFRDYIQHLFVKNLNNDELEEIFSACSGTRSLVLFQGIKRIEQIPSIGATRPRRLSLYVNDLLDTKNPPRLPLPPMFTFVTHLDLFDQRHHNHTIGHLVGLPALTHLALWENSMDTAERTDVLTRCRGLETLIEMHGILSDWDPERLPSIADVRFMAMVISDEDYLEDWVFGTKGGLDFWARADIFIAKKRRGEIKPESRCWIEEGDGI
ncbi:hypothetical protein MVEN_00260400 [Mycena venus]|uniref:Uncharacterized protein n=1 Tax=Mycena venus TaxID=2733690 RepID=A0A8H6Z3S0_9AGAR|nr:hypothetical protein MVEN_00260400 [Mycena venus]